MHPAGPTRRALNLARDAAEKRYVQEAAMAGRVAGRSAQPHQRLFLRSMLA